MNTLIGMIIFGVLAYWFIKLVMADIRKRQVEYGPEHVHVYTESLVWANEEQTKIKTVQRCNCGKLR